MNANDLKPCECVAAVHRGSTDINRLESMGTQNIDPQLLALTLLKMPGLNVANDLYACGARGIQAYWTDAQRQKGPGEDR